MENIAITTNFFVLWDKYVLIMKTLKNDFYHNVLEPIVTTPPVIDYGDLVTGVTIGLFTIIIAGYVYSRYFQKGLIEYRFIDSCAEIHHYSNNSTCLRQVSLTKTAVANKIRSYRFSNNPIPTITFYDPVDDSERIPLIFDNMFTYYIFRLYRPYGIIYYPDRTQRVVQLVRDITITREIVVWIYPDKLTSFWQELPRSVDREIMLAIDRSWAQVGQ